MPENSIAQGHKAKGTHLVEISVDCSGSNICGVFVYPSIGSEVPVKIVFAAW